MVASYVALKASGPDYLKTDNTVPAFEEANPNIFKGSSCRLNKHGGTRIWPQDLERFELYRTASFKSGGTCLKLHDNTALRKRSQETFKYENGRLVEYDYTDHLA